MNVRADLTNLIEDHFVRTWTMIGSGAGGVLVEDSDFQLTLAAINHIPYNHLQRFSPTGDPDPMIEAVLRTFGEREAIWSITSSSVPSDLADRLAGRGSKLYSLLTGMSLDLSEPLLEIEPSEGVRIDEVTPDLLGTWADLVLDQWHLSDPDREALLTMHREFGFETVRRWLCFVDETPVAKVSAVIHEPECAGIYGMGTRPEARGRGLATTLMLHVLRILREAHTRTVVLQSTPVAVDIYRRLGFVEHCKIPVYTVPHSEPPSERLART